MSRMLAPLSVGKGEMGAKKLCCDILWSKDDVRASSSTAALSVYAASVAVGVAAWAAGWA